MKPKLEPMADKNAKPKLNDKAESGVELLGRLSDSEAAAVLWKLLKRHEDLRASAEDLAREMLSGTSASSVADEVEDALLQFDYDDLNDRAGNHSWGYVEPAEAAAEMLEETLEPFVKDVQRYLEAGLEDQARELCQGILLGLYRIRGSENDVLNWAPDFPEEAADDALQVRRETAAPERGGAPERKTHRQLSPDFVRDHIPDWDWLLKSQS